MIHEEAFKRIACEALGLPYLEDVNAAGAGEYHHLGTFKPEEAEAVVDAAVAWYRSVDEERWGFYSYRDYLYACGHAERYASDLQKKLPREEITDEVIAVAWPKYAFLDAFSRDTYTPDRTGYLRYLANVRPPLRALLRRDIPVFLPEKERRLHSYVTGVPGSGKSELQKILAHSYTTSRRSAVVVLDPHGECAAQIAKWREHLTSDRLVYIDPLLRRGYTPTLNPLQLSDSSEKAKQIAAQEIMQAFQELIKGPVGGDLSVNMQTLLIPCLLTLLDRGDATLKDLKRFMDDKRNHDLVALGRNSSREDVRDFFEHDFSEPNFLVTKRSLRSKLNSLLNFRVFADLTCGPSTVDLEEAINRRKIVVFNLSRGTLGPDVSEAFGRLVMAMLQGLAMRRAEVSKSKRVPVHLIVDECQNYISRSTIAMLEETRKYMLFATLGQQNVGRGMTQEQQRVVVNLTNLKCAGRATDPDELRRLEGMFDVNRDTIRCLGTGEFLLKAGTTPTFKLATRTDLLDWRNTVTAPSWRRMIRKQIRAYYRNAFEVHNRSEESPECPRASDTPARPRHLELI